MHRMAHEVMGSISGINIFSDHISPLYSSLELTGRLHSKRKVQCLMAKSTSYYVHDTMCAGQVSHLPNASARRPGNGQKIVNQIRV